MRKKVLHSFGVTHFAEVTGFLVRQEGRAEKQNEQSGDEHSHVLFWFLRRSLVVRVHI